MFKFNEVGKSIKTFAESIATLIFFLYIIIAIALFVLGVTSQDSQIRPMLQIAGVVVALAGVVVARLSSIRLYGFGELVDNMMDVNNRVKNIENKIVGNSTGSVQQSSLNIQPPCNSNVNNTGHSASMPIVEHENSPKPTVVAKLYEDGSWICTCGRRNASYISSCACGKSKHDMKFQ